MCSSPRTAGCAGSGQVDDVQRVDLAEGDDVGELLDEANGVDPLAQADAADLADHRQATAVGEHRDDALRRSRGRPTRPARRW